MELSKRHAVITGASAGIGAALAKALAARGARVTLVARRRAALESVAAGIRARGGAAEIVVADLVADPTGWLSAVERPIDVLVNNAGVQVIAPTAEVDPEAGERSLALNLGTPLRLIRRLLPGMLARGEGSIVNVASMASIAPTPGMTYYNAGKCGLAGASEALRGELRGTGVRVLTVYPGLIDTDMATAGFAAYESSLALRAQPIGRPDVLAAHVVRAVERDRARVVYPRFNLLAPWFPNVTRWVLDRLAPAVRAAPEAHGSVQSASSVSPSP